MTNLLQPEKTAGPSAPRPLRVRSGRDDNFVGGTDLYTAATVGRKDLCTLAAVEDTNLHSPPTGRSTNLFSPAAVKGTNLFSPAAVKGTNLCSSPAADDKTTVGINKIVIPTGAYPKGARSGGTCCFLKLQQIFHLDRSGEICGFFYD
jgi:hypothetical protein